MRLTGVVLAAGLAILTTGCTPAATTSPPAESLGTQVFTPCQEVFRPGRTIIRSEALTACAAVDGSSRTPQYIRCADGRRLWRVDETMSTERDGGSGAARSSPRRTWTRTRISPPRNAAAATDRPAQPQPC